MTDTAPAVDLRQGQATNLALATAAFAVSFWAWNMIAPLAVRYADDMGLSSSQKSMIIATPVLVGSLGRIIAGALTDRFGGRLMFTLLLLVTAPCVLLVALAGTRDSYGLMLLFGLLQQVRLTREKERLIGEVAPPFPPHQKTAAEEVVCRRGGFLE